jgi:hypothetical protein
VVFKRYIYRNGKRFGPYYYHNKKVDGKVISNYVGTTPNAKPISGAKFKIPFSPFAVKLVISVLSVIIIVLLVNLIFKLELFSTGNVPSILTDEEPGFVLKNVTNESNLTSPAPEIKEEIFRDIPAIIEEKGYQDFNPSITTNQESASLNQPVKWVKEIKLQQPGKTIVYLPLESEKIKVYKIKDGKKEEISNERIKITAKASAEIVLDNEESSITSFFKKIFDFLTGKVVSIRDINDVKEVLIDENWDNYGIEYETPSPVSTEAETQKGKRVELTGPDNIHYENILAFTTIPETFNLKNPSKVKIYWLEQNTYLEPTKVEDKDSNGIYDYVEWIVPSLSVQTFEIIIITNAEHLDSSREFVSDIYEEVNQTDNITYTIPEGEYARAYFEKNLTKNNFVDIFSQDNGLATIEVYEKDSDVLVGSVELNETGAYFIDLEFEGEQYIFDLKSSKGDVVYDFIHDAPPTGNLTDVSLVVNNTNINEGDQITVTGVYDNTGSGTGSWTIQLRSTDIFSTLYSIDGTCLVGEGFRVVSIDTSGCAGGSCTTNVGTGTVSLTLNKNQDGNVIVWTLQACSSSSNYDPYTIRTILISVGNANLNDVTSSITVNLPSNQPPQVIFVQAISPQTPIEGTTKTIIFEARVSDINGAGDISSVQANFSKPGEPTRFGTCSFVNNIDLNTANYSCSINMQYYDAPLTWNISVNASDSFGAVGINNTQTFEYIELKAIILTSPVGALNWPTLSQGQTNVFSNNDPTTIENTGNYQGPILITAKDLLGVSNPSYSIPASNFRAGNVSGSECSATALVNDVATSISGSSLTKGPGATEDIYYCIASVPSIQSQAYSASGGNSWIIGI